jgi:hypothetical protein
MQTTANAHAVVQHHNGVLKSIITSFDHITYGKAACESPVVVVVVFSIFSHSLTSLLPLVFCWQAFYVCFAFTWVTIAS